MQFSTLLLALPAAFVAANPTTDKVNRQVASGCYPFQDPDCGIDYTVCQCANGWFYELNQDNANNGNYCNPPWAYLASSESELHGYSCY